MALHARSIGKRRADTSLFRTDLSATYLGHTLLRKRRRARELAEVRAPVEEGEISVAS